ncbi:MAG: hypothetical protein R3259_14420, partial [Salinimicrobium sediminis]|nr:hypothetical protein [Salinimicrobium sediminis]
PPPSAPPLRKGRIIPYFWKDRLVEIKGVEPFLPVPYPGFLFSIISELRSCFKRLQIYNRF